MTIRIIPRLDIKGPNLVKGINFEGLRVLGKPEDFARYYYHQGADELIYMDAVASLYNRSSLTAIVEKTAREIFIPLTVGGGLRTVDDIRQVLRAGADKVSLNTAALAKPEIIRQASQVFGSSTIVVSIEAIRHLDGSYEAYANFGREGTRLDVFDWADHAVALGAGELMVTAINHEGTGRGFDLELTRQIAERVSVPVIAAGGAGKLADVRDVVIDGKADAVALASMLHYNALYHQPGADNDFSQEGNTEFLRQGVRFSRFHDTTLPAIKSFLGRNRIACRQVVKSMDGTVHPAKRPVAKNLPVVAIVDFGLGNLQSVQQACSSVGLQAAITSDKTQILKAEAVILPGVGAFGDAIVNMERLDLIGVLRDVAVSSTPLVGICLGLQLLMSESCEFGRHRGLNIIPGQVSRLNAMQEDDRVLKVPQIGWNRINPAPQGKPWSQTLLKGLDPDAYMYFVHSFVVAPHDSKVALSMTRYGDVEFSSAITCGNISAFQFHPERSGGVGLKIYRNLAEQLYYAHEGDTI